MRKTQHLSNQNEWNPIRNLQNPREKSNEETQYGFKTLEPERIEFFYQQHSILLSQES